MNELVWPPWLPLWESWLGQRLPNVPGLYRIRRAGRDDLDYIGQTGAGGMTLKKRIGMLRGVYAEVMPYRDPHTAGPALWALRHKTGCAFEVSVAEVVGNTPWRKGLEAVTISIYRQQHAASPTVNFGRMPSGYRMSSGHNTKLVMSASCLVVVRATRCLTATSPVSRHVARSLASPVMLIGVVIVGRPGWRWNQLALLLGLAHSVCTACERQALVNFSTSGRGRSRVA
jgi:hypothetical protein